MRSECDVLVIGGGGAAVRAAIVAADAGARVTMVDKGSFGRSGTSPLGLHGLAGVWHSGDSPETLAGDIIKAGCEVNDQDLVITAARSSMDLAEWLQKMGVAFVHMADGSLEIYQGSGHSVPHGLILDEKITVVNPVAALGKQAWKRGVNLVEEVMIIDLLIDNGTVIGAVGIDRENQLQVFSAKSIILAAGGANGIYPNVTPRIAHKMYRTTGDGYCLALRAGLSLVDMEFANFRDTPPLGRLHGKLVNSLGEDVMEKYAPNKGGTAPRGKIVEAIYRELQAGRGPLTIELEPGSERLAEFLTTEYKVYIKAWQEGRRPPVTITFQRLLGGARINADTSTEISGLYAAGENAGGIHGADRLQGAAWLEGQVFGGLAGANAADFAKNCSAKDISESMVEKVKAGLPGQDGSGQSAKEIIKQIQKIAWDSVSIIRTAEGLKTGLDQISSLREELNRANGQNITEVLEAANLALCAEVVMRAALAREETRGTHRRSDFPELNPDLSKRHVSVTIGKDQQLAVEIVPSRDMA